jgi:leucyl aminopeptidase
MLNLSLFRKFNVKLGVLALLLISLISIFYGSLKSYAQSNENSQNQAGKKTDGKSDASSSSIRWLTVNENELGHVQNAAQSDGDYFDLKIVEKREGLSIVAADESQVLALTKGMHNEFHKCAGFVSHQTLEAARLAIDEALRADANQRLIEYTINNQSNVNSLLAETQEPQIRETIIRLSTDFPNRRYDLPSGLNSANWIKNKWAEIAANRSDITVEFFDHTTIGSPQPSIILTVRGTALPDEIVVLGAHQDSINRSAYEAPGADDDASGIASLTEALRIVVAKNFRPQRTLKFMAYAAEEVGLVGSNAIAADFQSRGVNVVGVLQLDMTNYKSVNSTIDIAIITDRTNAGQNQFLRDLIATYQPNLTIGDSTCGYGCSDHASWYNKGYPASFPFESAFSNSNPYIHQTTDTISQSGNNAVHAVKFTKLALSYLGELAKGTINSAASTASIEGTVSYGTTDLNQPAKFVSNVFLTAEGVSPDTDFTDNTGAYLLENLRVGEVYTVTLTKSGDINGITPFDATLVLRHVAAGGVGANALSANQQLAADTNNSNSITPFDATQILRFVAANGQTANTGAVGNWRFNPASRTYPALNGSLLNQNYAAILIGEINGSWTPPAQ